MEKSKVIGYFGLGITAIFVVLGILKALGVLASPSNVTIFVGFMIGQIFYNFRIERAFAKLDV